MPEVPVAYTFGSKETRDRLARLATNPRVNRLLTDADVYPRNIKKYNKLWWATAKTIITAATPGQADTDYTLGTGDAYFLKLNRDTGKFEQVLFKNDQWLYQTVYNTFTQSIPIDDEVVFPILQDRYHDFYVQQTPNQTIFTYGKVYSSAITSGSTGTVREWDEAWSSEIGSSVTVKNYLSLDLAVGSKVRWAPIPGWTYPFVELVDITDCDA